MRRVLATVGPTYRPLGERALIDALVQAIPALTPVGTFGWMDCRSPAGGPSSGTGTAEWLPETTLPEVEAFVAASFPASYAKPGVPGVERWAGVRDDGDRLAAVGALAWSAPTVGLLAGIAVRPQTRSRGLGRQVCGFLLAEALRLHGAAALMVDDWNHAAVRLYLGMGLRHRSLGAASVRT